MITYLSSALGSLMLAWFLTGQALRYAQARQLIDRPGLRRSHSLPTPRGGGIGFVLPVVLLLPVLGIFNPQHWPFFTATLGAGALLALVGFADDHSDQPASRRLLLQLLAAGIYLALAGWPSIYEFAPLIIRAEAIPAGAGLLALLAFLGLVWLVNLTNFMDGSNGLVAVQLIFSASVFAVLNGMAGEVDLALLSLVLATAVLGYLPWNFPRARVFMGDVGSYFGGFMLAVLALESQRRGSVSMALALLAMAPMVLDATLTLFKRALQRRRLAKAHREHLYQMLIRQGCSHAAVVAWLAMLLGLLVLPLLIWGYHWPSGQGLVLLLFSLGFAFLWQTQRSRYRSRRRMDRRNENRA